MLVRLLGFSSLRQLVLEGVVFLFGGVLPLTWFILSRGRRLVRVVDVEEGEWSVYDKDLAAQEEPLPRA